MARFFEYPINYVGNRSYSAVTPAVYLPAVQDNDYNTGTGETTIDVYIDSIGDGSGAAQDFTALFVKCKGVSRYGVVVSDGNITTLDVTIPVNLHLYDTPVMDVRGFQNHLYIYEGVAAVANGKRLRFTFSGIVGETPAIYEIMVLNQVLAIDEDVMSANRVGFSHIEYDHIERGSVVQQAITGVLSKSPPLNNTRSKYRVRYRTRYKAREDLDRMLAFKEDYAVFAFAPNYALYPHLVFPALFSNSETPIRYSSSYTLGSRTLELTIDER